MAKKADRKSITWVMLSEAKARADSVYQSRDLVERRLRSWLLDRKLRWRSADLEGLKRDCDPGSGDSEFWREPVLAPPATGDPVVFFNWRNLIITWDKSCARRRISSTSSYTFYRIEVAEDDLAKLLPASPPRRQKTPRRVAVTPITRVEAVVRELWPNGVPKTKTNKELLRQLGGELDQRGILAETTTQLRALRRRTK